MIEGAQVQAEGGVARQAGHGEPEDSGSFNGVPIHLVLPQLQVRRAGLTVEVEREGVRREKLGEGHGGVEVAHGDDVVGGDAQALQFPGHETAEGVIPHAGDDAGAMPEARGGDGDVRRATAEKLSEGLDVFEVGANLERINVNAGTTHCQNVDIAALERHGVSFLSIGVARRPFSPRMHYQQAIVKLCPYNM